MENFLDKNLEKKENRLMNKKILIIVASSAAVLLLVGLGVYFRNKTNVEPVKESTAEEMLIEGAAKGTLPSLETNPLESKPDLNPADKANPFKDIKTNPFE